MLNGTFDGKFDEALWGKTTFTIEIIQMWKALNQNSKSKIMERN